MTVLSEHVWDYEIILKKNVMSLQCRYLCKFPASSILSSTVPQFSAQGGAGGTPWGPGVLSCFRWKLHPPSQAWPLLSTSNRGEIAIAKCGNWLARKTWLHHQMETFSALLALCAGNSPVYGEFPARIPVTRSFDVFFDLRLIKRLSKHSRGWWFETLSRTLWRHCNVYTCSSSIWECYISRNREYHSQICIQTLRCHLTHWGRDKMTAIFQTTFSNGFS